MPDFPHHSDMDHYINQYAQHFGVVDHIKFKTKVSMIKQHSDRWQITTVKVGDDDNLDYNESEEVEVKYIAIATGHHARPNLPTFENHSLFQGSIMHSVHYKDAIKNGHVNKRVVVVGIGNSAVDVTVNLATVGRCPVYLSTRSGAWIVPNYVAGYPTDYYACRAFLWLPWQLASQIFELVLRCVFGSPWKWNLNPRMSALQTQPTVSATLIHHIQRNNIQVKPNIATLEPNGVIFTDGSKTEADAIVCCTGYHVDLPFLDADLNELVLEEGTNKMKLFKGVFSPEIGKSLGFIGFAQPASGGLLTVSETQARWFSALCKGLVSLPSKELMYDEMKRDEQQSSARYFASPRHTFQKDPITYNDEIAAYFGAKPQLWRHPRLVWNLVFGSGGAAQWRLQGPHKSHKAEELVRSVPVTPMMHCFGVALLSLLFLAVGSFVFVVFQ